MPLFSSTCDALTDFTEGSGVYQDITNGQTVTVVARPGAGQTGNCLQIISNANSAEVGVRFGTVSNTANQMKIDFNIDALNPINTTSSQAILGFFADDGKGGYSNTQGGTSLYMQLTIQGMTGTNYPANAYKLAITYPNPYGSAGSGQPIPSTLPAITAGQSYITTYLNPPLVPGTWYTFEVRQTASVGEFAVYINNRYAGSMKYLPANVHFRAVGAGKFYGTGFVGKMYLDNIVLDALPANNPTTPASQMLEAYYSWVKTYVAPPGDPLAGAVIRPIGFPYADGQNFVTGEYRASDWVSEGQGYGMRLAASFVDQATFDSLENARYTIFRRANVPSTAQNYLAGLAPNLMGFHWFDDTRSWQDANAATDAEMDVINALLTAHLIWGSASSSHPNYLVRALAVANDLKSNCFRSVTLAGSTYQIMTADMVNGNGATGPSPFETNPSYADFQTYQLLISLDTANTAFWTTALNSQYTYLPKTQTYQYSGAGTGPGASSALFPDWAGIDNVFNVSNSPNSRNYDYSYNAFRVNFRLAQHYILTADSRALAILNGPIRSFFLAQWNTQAEIFMQYYKDGTVEGNYEKSMGTYSAYHTQAYGTATAVANTMFNTKIANVFLPSANGGFYADNPSGTNGFRSYFSDSWMLLGHLQHYGTPTASQYLVAPALAGSPVTGTPPPSSVLGDFILLGVG